MVKKIIYITTAVLLAGSIKLQAQVPDWGVNPGAFQYTMTITAFLNVDGSTLESNDDLVAAMVDGQVRGVASPIYVESSDRYLTFLTVYANKDGEQVQFSLYQSGSNKVATVDTVVTYSIDQQIGNTFQAFSLASPALSISADILDFSFYNQDSISTIIEDGVVNISIAWDGDLTALSPEFVLSDGAALLLDRDVQISGENTLDFTDPVTYSVLSEDESTLKEYVVTAVTQGVEGNGFFSSNVITANGDGDNDFWVVQDEFIYNSHTFKIFDVNGRVIYESVGYDNDWDGTVNGKKLDRGKYFFTVENKESGEMIQGSILLIY